VVPLDIHIFAQWELVTGEVGGALLVPEKDASKVRIKGTERTFESVVDGLLTFDALCHTWDLARAAGFSEILDRGAVAMCDAAQREVGDALRSPGRFGPPIEPERNADLQTRFLNFTGRSA
jgi:hypothetical protein